MLIMLCVGSISMYSAKPDFKVLVLTERGGQHEGFVVAALKWLDNFAQQNKCEITVVNNTDKINDNYLNNYQVFIQLNYPPYNWTDVAKTAFIKYINQGLGGWVGFHHATLLGEFDGFSMWQWFSGFMGDIRYKNYIAAMANGSVCVEDATHPVMKDIPPVFTIPNDEWYIYDKSPRPNVHVLAHVDEASYQPASNITMGDHPVIWTNEKVKARNVYFQMGHHPTLFTSTEFKTLFSMLSFGQLVKNKKTY